MELANLFDNYPNNKLQPDVTSWYFVSGSDLYDPVKGKEHSS